MSKIRLTIGTKLVSLIAILLLGSIASIVWLSTRMFIEDNTALIQQMNADTATSLATRMRELFENVTEKMRVLGSVELQDFAQPDGKARIIQEFFNKDKDFLAVLVYKHQDAQAPQAVARAISPDLATLGDADGEKSVANAVTEKDFSLSRVERGEVLIASSKLADGSPAIAIAIPFIAADKVPGAPGGDRFSHTLLAVVRQSMFLKVVSDSDIITSFMVDGKGRLLAHPDSARVASGENVSQLGVVKQLLEGKFNNGQTRYVDPQSGEARLGAYHLVGFNGLGVVAEVAEAKAFEAAHRVEVRSIYIACIVMCIAFLVGYFYSGTITWPIKQLVNAAKAIAAGDFNIHLKAKSRDEVATLSLAFNDMAKGLEERDKVKETFNKFHNKEIAEKLLSGEVKLGGERKEATIFFSDVRGFTAMSETMEPEQVVEMLNEYMTRMVSIVRKHHGIVDKYVGDAIMAIWGVPIPGPEDTFNAVTACLEMRQELAALNELRLSRGQGALKIGMGLNVGPVIAGNIGSVEKMEYTVIGDSVNLASRMESMTKEYGTDFLIPRAIRDKVEGKFVFEQCQSAKVKGKAQAIEIFKVRGYVDANGQEVLVQTAYSSYESEKSDKVVHDEPKHDENEAHGEAQAPAEHAPVAEAQYFIDLFGDVLGPFTADEIRFGVADHDFTAETPVALDRAGPWRTIDEQFGLVGPVVAAPSPAPVDEAPTPAAATATPEPVAPVEHAAVDTLPAQPAGFVPPSAPAGLRSPRLAVVPVPAPVAVAETPAPVAVIDAPSPTPAPVAVIDAPSPTPAPFAVAEEPAPIAIVDSDGDTDPGFQLPPEAIAPQSPPPAPIAAAELTPAPVAETVPAPETAPETAPADFEIQPLEVIVIEKKKKAA